MLNDNKQNKNVRSVRAVEFCSPIKKKNEMINEVIKKCHVQGN